MKQATDEGVSKRMPQETPPSHSGKSSVPSAPCNAAAAPSSAVTLKSEEPLPAAPEASGNAPDENQAGEPVSDAVLFGRQTFSMPFSEQEDRTGFFDDLDNEPEAAATEVNKTHFDFVMDGENGVIPVACMVKIMQALQEKEDGSNQIALLLAGMVAQRFTLFANRYHSLCSKSQVVSRWKPVASI